MQGRRISCRFSSPQTPGRLSHRATTAQQQYFRQRLGSPNRRSCRGLVHICDIYIYIYIYIDNVTYVELYIYIYIYLHNMQGWETGAASPQKMGESWHHASGRTSSTLRPRMKRAYVYIYIYKHIYTYRNEDTRKS